MKHFWRLVRTYCLESTIVGLKYFYLYPDILSRCFWAINMICMLAMSFMLTILLYNRFEEMPTRVTIETQFAPIYHLPYPAIFLCSPNQMTISSLKYFNKTLVDGNLTIDLETALPMILGFYEVVNDFDTNKLKQLQDIFDINRYTIPEVIGILPQSCNRFIKSCLLEGKRYNDCGELFKPVLTTHGYCCAFNSAYVFDGKRNIWDPKFVNRTINSVGYGNALTIVTDYDVNDALWGTLLHAGAIRVMFTDWSEFPADDETTIVDPNGEAYHILKATYTYCSEEVQSLPVWSRKCYFEDERRLPFFRKYHNSDCDHVCYMEAVHKACGCYLPYLPYVRSDIVCTITSIPCIIGVKKDMSTWLSAQQCECPRDCVSRRYHSELIMGNFNAVPYLLRNPFSGLVFNSSTSVMRFFFSNPVYVKQKQETVMSIISLVSNLGGVFGLFMGCSGISVLEILFYIYIGVKKYIGRRRVLPQDTSDDYIS